MRRPNNWHPHVDLDLQRRLLGDLSDMYLAADVGEAAADLGHQVAGDELERRVRRVDRPGPDLGNLAAVDEPGPGGDGDCLSHVHLSSGMDWVGTPVPGVAASALHRRMQALDQG